jgi:2-iminobutanoate/2-iminopropanoate deaminase
MADLPYTPLYRAGELCFVSGQIGIGEAGLEDDFAVQFRQALSNFDSLLGSHGLERSQVARTTVYLTDMDDYAAMNQIYADYFGDHRPARSAVAVAGLPFGALVEIDAWVHDPS